MLAPLVGATRPSLADALTTAHSLLAPIRLELQQVLAQPPRADRVAVTSDRLVAWRRALESARAVLVRSILGLFLIEPLRTLFPLILGPIGDAIALLGSVPVPERDPTLLLMLPEALLRRLLSAVATADALVLVALRVV